MSTQVIKTASVEAVEAVLGLVHGLAGRAARRRALGELLSRPEVSAFVIRSAVVKGCVIASARADAALLCCLSVADTPSRDAIAAALIHAAMQHCRPALPGRLLVAAVDDHDDWALGQFQAQQFRLIHTRATRGRHILINDDGAPLDHTAIAHERRRRGR